MSGGGQSPVTTTATTNTPWAPVAAGFSQTIPIAEQYQQGGVGYNPYLGQTVADLQPSQTMGLQQMQDIAQSQMSGDAPYRGLTTLQAGIGQADDMIRNQGLTPGIQGAIGGLGQVGQQYNQIYNDPTTMGAYQKAIGNMGTENPYLQQMLASTIGNQINSSMAGAGRYGSGAHQEAIAAGESPALAQDWATRQQMGLGAAGQMSQQQLQATQGMGNVQGSLADLYGQGLNRAGQWAQLVPGMMQGEYLPAQMQGQVGSYLQQRAQQQLQGGISQYNAQQAYPWEQLARENAIIGGAGGLGGTSVASQSTQVPLGQRLLGGALAGGGLGGALGGPFGAGIGAIGGGLAGGFL